MSKKMWLDVNERGQLLINAKFKDEIITITMEKLVLDFINGIKKIKDPKKLETCFNKILRLTTRLLYLHDKIIDSMRGFK